MAANADYELAAASLSGTTRAFIQEWAFTYIRRLSGFSEIDMQVVPGTLGSKELLIGSRLIKVWRNNVSRFVGRIGEPLLGQPDQVQVKAFDAAHNLTLRRVPADVNGNGPVYTNQEASSLMWDRVVQQNARGLGSMRLQQGALAVAAPMTVQFPPRKVEYEIWQQIAQSDGGPYWRIDPLDNTTGIWGTFNTFFPQSGTDRPGAKFEFGEGTLANCSSYEYQDSMPKNLVYASGANTGTAEMIGTASDATSQATYDLMEDVISASDAQDQDRVNKIAIDNLFPLPVRTYKMTPLPTAPSLFDDFDVGDITRYKIRDVDFDVDGTWRITEAQVKVTSSGTEILDSVAGQVLTAVYH